MRKGGRGPERGDREICNGRCLCVLKTDWHGMEGDGWVRKGRNGGGDYWGGVLDRKGLVRDDWSGLGRGGMGEEMIGMGF